MFKRTTTTLVISSLAALLAACGGGSSDSPPATGEVAVVLTDGPTDQYDRVLVSLTAFTLIGPGGHVDLYNGPEITFDLLEMSEWGDLAFNTKVLAGQYNKIRLQLTRVMLEDTETGTTEELTSLPAGGKIDLNPRGPFDVSPDYTTVIKLDMDAQRSFQVVQTGNAKLQLRPIFFVDVYEGNIFLPDRLVRVFGTVEDGSIDTTDNSFRLCDLEFISQVSGSSAIDPDACVRVYTEIDTGIFDDVGMQSDFLTSVAANAGATAVGFVTDTADADAFLGLDAVSIGVGDRMPYATGGGWDTVQGIVTASPVACADQCFDFDPADSDPAITTHMQPATRVFRADGVELNKASVTVDDAGSVDAYRADDMSDLFASLVVLSTDVGGGIVTGSLTLVDSDMGYTRLHVMDEAGGETLVCVDADTNIVKVLADDEVVTLFDLLDPAVLETGALIEAYGDEAVPGGVSCDILAAQVIVEPVPAP